ncbi:MAG: haloacid dehalogenase type II [Chthoniobacterales bacterium]|nr:haloacid dehalogenase type II [Chthoniobacterales bacterium]
MRTKPKAVVLDVIETCFAIDSLGEKLEALGLPEGSLKVWFPRVLRDAFALQVTGTYKPFGEIATGALAALLAENKIEPDPSWMKSVIEAFATLPVHPDVAEGIELLLEAGVRVAALTNGSAETTKKMFQNAGLEQSIEKFISIEEVKQWKPSAAVYLHAAKTLGVKADELALVAARDWDIDGAGKAGLTTAYLARKQPHGSSAMRPADVRGASLPEAARALLALPDPP